MVLKPITPQQVLDYTRSTDAAMAERISAEYNRTWAGATYEIKAGTIHYSFPKGGVK